MAIIKQPRAVNAGLARIDYSTTARLGEKGIDLVTTAIQKKQAEDKLRYETAKSEREQAQVNLASFDAKVQANPELLEFLQTDDGTLGKAFDSYENGKVDYQDSLILTGGADNFIQAKNSKIASNLQNLQLLELERTVENREVLGKATASAYTYKDILNAEGESTGEKELVYDSTVGEQYLIEQGRPDLINKLKVDNLAIEEKQALIESRRTQDQTAYLEASAKAYTAQKELAETQGEKTHNALISNIASNALVYEQSTGEKYPFEEAQASYILGGGNDYVAFEEWLKGASETGSIALSPKEQQDIDKQKQQQEIKSIGYVSGLVEDTLQVITVTDRIFDNTKQMFGDAGKSSFFLSAFDFFDAGPLGIGGGFNENKANLQILTSKDRLNKMGELKEQSDTGATGLGPINFAEFQALGADLADLETAMRGGRQDFLATLEDYRYASLRLGLKGFEAFRAKYGYSNQEALDKLPVGADAMNTIISELEKLENSTLIRAYGGSYLTLLADNKDYIKDFNLENDKKKRKPKRQYSNEFVNEDGETEKRFTPVP
jgi:hypothetical protein